MKKNYFFLIFLSTNIALVFFHIYKQSVIIKLSYEKQRKEQTIEDYIQEKKELEQIMEQLKNRAGIKAFANNQLSMHKARLSDIHCLDAKEEHAISHCS